jgi:hypothetical protein
MAWDLTPYHLFLVVVLLSWPALICGLLFLMSRLEGYVEKMEASTPEEAGLEPVAGTSEEREVTIVLGDRVVGRSE